MIAVRVKFVIKWKSIFMDLFALSEPVSQSCVQKAPVTSILISSGAGYIPFSYILSTFESWDIAYKQFHSPACTRYLFCQ